MDSGIGLLYDEQRRGACGAVLVRARGERADHVDLPAFRKDDTGASPPPPRAFPPVLRGKPYEALQPRRTYNRQPNHWFS
jgi:hypothetical protein